MQSQNEWMTEKQHWVNDHLLSIYKSCDSLPQNSNNTGLPALNSACEYPLRTGGKRIRPLFLFATIDCLGTGEELNTDRSSIRHDALIAAGALELVHTYSLVHDDLPCMDDDDFRRGQPTVHKKYSESIAVLVGDSLLTMAFQQLARCRSTIVPQLITTLAGAAGSAGMIAGQSYDIGFEGPVTDVETLTLLHRLKTGALIKAGVEMGAIISEADQLNKNLLMQYAEHVGLAFQLADDLLDAEEDANVDGPPSFVKLLGESKTRALALENQEQAIAVISSLPEPEKLTQLAKYTVHRLI